MGAAAMAGESASFLRQEAARFHKLARDITDERTLTGLAEELEASSSVAEAALPSPEPPTTTTAPDADGRAR
jgi:hypothetical protein